MHSVILHSITKKNGPWSIRVDSRHGGEWYHRKHVHISKKGLKGEYSWNDDGSRHDEHRFPNNELHINKAKKLAADAMSVPVSSLSMITALPGGGWYRFSSGEDKMVTYVKKNKVLVIFEVECYVVTVVLDC